MVREAVGSLATPDVRDLVLATALGRAGLAAVPSDPEGLGVFVREHLAPEAEARLGAGTASILIESLDEVVRRTSLVGAPPGEPAPAPPSPRGVPAVTAAPVEVSPVEVPLPGAPASSRAASPEDAHATDPFDLEGFPAIDLPAPDLTDLPPPPPPEHGSRDESDAFGPGPRDPFGSVLYALHVATRLQRLEGDRRRLLAALPLARKRASMFLVHLARRLVARDQDLVQLRGSVADVLDEARNVEGRVASRGLAVLLTVAETVDAAVPGAVHGAGASDPVDAVVAVRRLARSVTHLGGQALRLGWGDVAQAATSTAVALRRSADLEEELARNRLVVESYDEDAYRRGLRVLAAAAVTLVVVISAVAFW